jgi:hypothetical protein
VRIIIVGGPRRGKSTLAKSFGFPIFCGDPKSKVKDPEPNVTYLPEDLPFAGDDGAAAHVAHVWFVWPGSWVCEGHVMARALRRWLDGPNGKDMPADKIIVLKMQKAPTTSGQEAMHKGVMKVWDEISHYFRSITEYR